MRERKKNPWKSFADQLTKLTSRALWTCPIPPPPPQRKEAVDPVGFPTLTVEKEESETNSNHDIFVVIFLGQMSFPHVRGWVSGSKWRVPLSITSPEPTNKKEGNLFGEDN